MRISLSSPSLTPTQERTLVALSAVAVISAMALIIALSRTPSAGKRLSGVTIATALPATLFTATTVAALGVLFRGALRKPILETSLPPLPPPTPPTEPQQLLAGALPEDETLASPVLETSEQMQGATLLPDPLTAAKNFLRAMDNVPDTDKAAIRAHFEQIGPAVEEALTYEHFSRNFKKGIENELCHFIHVAKKGWWKNGRDPDFNLAQFGQLQDKGRILKDALERAEELHYPYLFAFKEQLNGGTALDYLVVNETLHTRFLEQAVFQKQRLLSIPFYLTAYLVQRQGWFMYNRTPYAWCTPKALIKKGVEANCLAQLHARAPLFSGTRAQKILAPLVAALTKPIFNVMQGTATYSGPKHLTSSYTVTQVEDGFGRYLTEYFKIWDGSKWVAKPEFKALEENPFETLSELNGPASVQALADYIKGYNVQNQ